MTKFSIHPARIFGLAAILGASFLAMSTADANDRPARDPATPDPRLRREAVVEGDAVTLGDLVDRCGNVCATPLFRAPAPGETGVIQAVRVIAAAREAGLSGVDRRGVSQVLIARAGRAAKKSEVEKALGQAIAAQAGLAGDVAAALDQETVRLALATGEDSAPLVSDLSLDARNRRFTAFIGATRGGATARVSGGWTEMVMTPVLARALQRGDAVRADDIAIERRDREALAEDGAANAALLVGRVARAAMRAGTLLRERDFVKPILVERNAAVTVTLDTGGMRLMLKGKALGEGALGDVVGVQNLNSKRVVQGVVIGPGSVRMEPGAAGIARTAEARQ